MADIWQVASGDKGGSVCAGPKDSTYLPHDVNTPEHLCEQLVTSRQSGGDGVLSGRPSSPWGLVGKGRPSRSEKKDRGGGKGVDGLSGERTAQGA